MSKSQPDVDCKRRCKSRDHGQALTSAISKRSVTDQSLASFIRGTCANFVQALDHEGRTALHMAASRGRTELAEWLIHHSSEAFNNAKDMESGYTPLHRSIFYGQINAAVAFMKMGANTDAVDKDDYKALDHAMLDRQYMYKHDGSSPCDAYVWGSNSNYTLGTGAQRQKSLPEPLAGFSRTGTGVRQVCLGKFHSIWVCSSTEGGEVYACGQIARAGAPLATALRPVLLKLNEPCVQAAVTLNSTVLLMNSGLVLQYSLNSTDNASESTTRTPSSIKLPSVKPILKLSEPLGVCSSRAHVVVWNIRAIYTWGTNLGQLGHSQTEKVVETPRKVEISMTSREEATVKLASAADAATVIATSRGDVYLLHKHICKKIAIKQINLRQVCVEAKVNENGVFGRVTVLLLTNVGQLRIWTDESNRLTTCVFGLAHQTTVTHVTLTTDAMYFTTKYGEAFIGHISRRTAPVQATPKREKDRDSGKSALVKFLEKDDCTSVRLTRIPNVHRAVSIEVDSEGMNFACLQIFPTCGLTSLPELSPSGMAKHMQCLLDTTSEDDILHDVVFKVGQKLFPAHMFIVASGSELLYKLYQDAKSTNPDVTPTIALENVHQEVFQRILKYLYTGNCDVTEAGACALKIRRDLIKEGKKETDNPDNEPEYIDNPQEVSAFEAYKKNPKKGGKGKKVTETPVRTNVYCDPVKLVQAAAKRLQVMSLHKLLDKYFYRDGSIHLKDTSVRGARPAPPRWPRAAPPAPALVDTNVASRDGVPVPAHRCVLAARLEYFQGMFLHSWTESKLLSTVTLPINHSILLPIIDFLYTDSCPEVTSSDSIDFICSLLVVADQLFITRLREMCEVQLANLITLKNCAELCQFAHTYNSAQLKTCCMEYIALNMCAVLEARALEILDASLLEDISRYYCKFNPIMSSRVITPFYNAPSDDVIEECSKLYPVDLSFIDEELKRDEVESKKKSRKKSENERARKRYESVISMTSDLDTSLTKITESEKKTPEKWINIPTSQQKVQARLKAITSAKDILNETPVESFVTLTKGAFSSSPVEATTSFARMSLSPKESFLGDLAKSPPCNITISHVGPKLSQKQRKKLALQGSDGRDGFLLRAASESPQKPKNPWKVIEAPSASPVGKAPVFDQILADQKKLKDNSSRIMMKPLAMTQMEDKAIEELERFYNIHDIDDELISVSRIELQVSAPKWINTAPNL